MSYFLEQPLKPEGLLLYNEVTMSPLFLAAPFMLGLIVGSFLNVFVLRLGTGISLRGRSFCFVCGQKLSWYELIPLLSFIAQRGRCRLCRGRISLRYPIVELLTGGLFVLIFLKSGFPFSLYSLLSTLYYLFIFSILIAIATYDLKHKIIPDSLVYGFVILSFFTIFTHDFFLQTTNYKLQALGAGPLIALPFAVMWLFSKGRWIGLGDAKLSLGMGWLLGISGGAAALTIAVWIGAALGVLLALLGKAKKLKYLFQGSKRITIKSEIPFAPFLIIGTVLAFLYDISFIDIQSLFIF